MKKFIALILIVVLSLSLTACKDGNNIESGTADYTLIINYGTCFVYSFKDPETGVWYICTSDGITPRLNNDGTLYTE